MDTRAVLRATQHLQRPLPRGPWIMTQIWHELLFAHWPVRLPALRSLIPEVLAIDTYEGDAWVGIVPFRMSNVRPRGFPNIKGLSSFPELNVRAYVTLHGAPGVYFFSLDAGNPIAVALARSIYHLPYFNAIMTCEREGDMVHYRSHRTHRGAPKADFDARYRPVAPAFAAQPGSLEHWLTERYSLYTVFHSRVYCGGIHHRQWSLQPAEAALTCETMTRSQGIHLDGTQPLLHYADRQEVLIWPLRYVR